MLTAPPSPAAAGTAATTAAWCDQSHAIEAFFSSIRVPASFMTTVSFSELSRGSGGDGDGEDNTSRVQLFLEGSALVCQGFTFVLSLSVVMMSTSALIRGLAANFDPNAESGYALLFREFHYEFLCVRWSFNVAMLSFLLAVGAKVLYQFGLFDGGNGGNGMEVGISVVLVMAALILNLYSYVSTTLIGWDSMTDMTAELCRTQVRRGRQQPVETVSFVMLAAGLVFLVVGLIPGAQV